MSSCGHILWRSFRARYAPVTLGLLPQLTGHPHLARRLMSGAVSPLPICFHGVHWDKFIFLYLEYAHNYMHFVRTYKINDLMSSCVCNDTHTHTHTHIYIYIYILFIRPVFFSFLETILSKNFVWQIFINWLSCHRRRFACIAKACCLKKTSLFILGVVRKPCALCRQCAEFSMSKVENVVTAVLKG
jgi:hypothetical protein